VALLGAAALLAGRLVLRLERCDGVLVADRRVSTWPLPGSGAVTAAAAAAGCHRLTRADAEALGLEAASPRCGLCVVGCRPGAFDIAGGVGRREMKPGSRCVSHPRRRAGFVDFCDLTSGSTCVGTLDSTAREAGLALAEVDRVAARADPVAEAHNPQRWKQREEARCRSGWGGKLSRKGNACRRRCPSSQRAAASIRPFQKERIFGNKENGATTGVQFFSLPHCLPRTAHTHTRARADFLRGTRVRCEFRPPADKTKPRPTAGRLVTAKAPGAGCRH